jgi:hypothetical protein
VDLIDNSPTKFFTKVFLRGEDIEMSLRTSFLPDPAFMTELAKEGMNAVKGSQKSKLIVTMRDGMRTVRRVGVSTYEDGIIKASTPDGMAYHQLSESTLKIRREVKHIVRGAQYILRETSQHILNGLHIIRMQRNYRQSAGVSIGWSGENAEIAKRQNDGFTAINPMEEFMTMNRAERMSTMGSGSAKDVDIPARKFMAFSREFQNNFIEWFKAYMGGSE